MLLKRFIDDTEAFIMFDGGNVGNLYVSLKSLFGFRGSSLFH